MLMAEAAEEGGFYHADLYGEVTECDGQHG
jgi:hypothetical protein